MPNSRKSTTSRLPQPRLPAHKLATCEAQQLLNESAGGSDDSCCSADNAGILEACIASAMPSKSVKVVSSPLTDQAAKFQQQRLSLGRYGGIQLKSSVADSDRVNPNLITGIKKVRYLIFENNS